MLTWRAVTVQSRSSSGVYVPELLRLAIFAFLVLPSLYFNQLAGGPGAIDARSLPGPEEQRTFLESYLKEDPAAPSVTPQEQKWFLDELEGGFFALPAHQIWHGRRGIS